MEHRQMSNQAPYFVSKGNHPSRGAGMCAMEWVAYLAGESHTDSPVCVSPVLTRFCIAFNDRLPDAERQKLRPYLARTIGTRFDGLDEERRQMCTQWLLACLPDLFDRAGLEGTASKLRALPADVPEASLWLALKEARGEAYAARDAAMARLRENVRAELAKCGPEVAAEAAAAAAAAAVEAAVAAAVAAAAVAAVVAAVVAPAVAVEAVAPYPERWWETREAIYRAARAKADEILAPLLPSGFELLDRMLPKELLQLPVAEDAEAVCALP
jgi:hypothetical protein